MTLLSDETISGRDSDNPRVDGILLSSAHSARVFFGLILFANGLNWRWKFFPIPACRIMRIMRCRTHHRSCWTPFLLVFVFPLSLGIWAVDVFLVASTLRASVMGWAVFSLNGFLLVSYLDCYVPMLTRTVVPHFSGVGANRNCRNEAYNHRVRHHREPTGRNRGHLVECPGGSDDYRKMSGAELLGNR